MRQLNSALAEEERLLSYTILSVIFVQMWRVLPRGPSAFGWVVMAFTCATVVAVWLSFYRRCSYSYLTYCHMRHHPFCFHYSIGVLRTRVCGLHTFLDFRKIEKSMLLRNGPLGIKPRHLLLNFGVSLDHQLYSESWTW